MSKYAIDKVEWPEGEAKGTKLAIDAGGPKSNPFEAVVHEFAFIDGKAKTYGDPQTVSNRIYEMAGAAVASFNGEADE